MPPKPESRCEHGDKSIQTHAHTHKVVREGPHPLGFPFFCTPWTLWSLTPVPPQHVNIKRSLQQSTQFKYAGTLFKEIMIQHGGDWSSLVGVKNELADPTWKELLWSHLHVWVQKFVVSILSFILSWYRRVIVRICPSSLWINTSHLRGHEKYSD